MSVEADKFTYGQSNIKIITTFPGTKVKLGKYCSVAADVKAFLGGNHRVDWITTFPFGHISTNEINVSKVDGHPDTNGDIIIGNDVWLGTGCTLMSGITIGDGAVVAAHSHVVKDVAPYTVVGGNPAKPIKLRFEQSVVDALMELKWWDLELDVVKLIVPVLCAEPNYDKIQELIQKYKK
jgi:acetyltransferase-like isoleucine patch superfamily enzyme